MVGQLGKSLFSFDFLEIQNVAGFLLLSWPMGRALRNIRPLDHVHTIFRCINRQFLFASQSAHDLWLENLRRSKRRFDLTLYAWCGMTNHHHLLNRAPTTQYIETQVDGVVVVREEPASYGRFLCDTFSYFVRRFNRFFDRRSSLIDDRTKTVRVDDDHHCLNLLIYIFLNPVRAGIVKHPKDYAYSNYNQYARGDKKAARGLFSYHPAFLALGNTFGARRRRFCRLIEEALKDWANRRWEGASRGNGPGKNTRINAQKSFKSYTDAWLTLALDRLRGPPT